MGTSQGLSNLQIRREMFRLADASRIHLHSLHHPLTYDHHSVLRPGVYWHWSFEFGEQRAEHVMGAITATVASLYWERPVVIVPSGHDAEGVEVYIAALPSEAHLADGHKPSIKTDGIPSI